jgi:hypothetical protein
MGKKEKKRRTTKGERSWPTDEANVQKRKRGGGNKETESSGGKKK